MIALKQNVKQRFGNNYNTYDTEAQVQKRVATRLANCLPQASEFKTENVLEIGCGTGFLTEQMVTRYKLGQFMLNDITDSFPTEVLKRTNGHTPAHTTFVIGDAEKLEFPSGFDAIVSASCFQWFSHPQQFFNKAYGMLRPNGILAFSTFGLQNFYELRQVLGVGLPYVSLQQLKQWLSDRFSILHAEEWQEQLYFDTPKAVLRHMKLTGVNGTNNTFWGKEKLKNFCSDYAAQFQTENQQVQLTYHPIVLVLRKKANAHQLSASAEFLNKKHG